MKHLLILIAFVAGCSGATGPRGLDPTVLIVNQMPIDTVVSVWYDQSGQVQVDRVPPGVTFCEHFTSTLTADSVRFLMYVRDSIAQPNGSGGNLPFYATRSPWFDPKTGLGPDPTQYPFGAEFWTVTPTGDVGANTLTFPLTAVASAPC